MDESSPGADTYCSNCGERNTRQANYCHYCGEQLSEPGRDHAGPPGRDGLGRVAGGRDDRRGEWGKDPTVEPRSGGPDSTATPEDGGPDSTATPGGGGPDPAPGTQGTGPAPAAEPGESGAHDPTHGGEDARGGPVEGRRGATGRPPDRPGGAAGGTVDLGSSEPPWRTVGVAAGLGILGIVLLALVSVAVVLISSPIGLSAAVLLVVGTAIGQYVGFGGLALGYLRRRGFTWEQVRSYLGVRVPSLRELGVVVAGYVAIVVLLIVVAGIASVFLPEPAENQAVDTTASNPEIVPFMILMMFLVVGPMEELLFRGVVQNRIREHLPPLPSIAIASAIFAAVHVVALAGSLTGMLVTVFILFFPATIFGAVYEYTGNLVVPALLHATHNSVIVALIFLAPQMEGEAVLASLAVVGL